ncbi:MAG: TrkH family potassium uptake protein [Pirellulales bacterium]|nr:TrkH family potassium uptake protein [Pirellulales bacterium]
MNYRLIAKLLGSICYLIGGMMVFSLPWAWPALSGTNLSRPVETGGLIALCISIAICGLVGLVLRRWGKNAAIVLYRKEAMAVVGLSWVLATLLGALPFYFSGTSRGRENSTAPRPGSPIRMSLVDCMFESQSGFSTTGATVLTQIEDPELVPRCILFWRSSTHFLGGLGIIVLFVAVLGQGSAGKVMMRAEMPGPSKEGSQERMQHTAWVFTAIYCGLNAALAILLKIEGALVLSQGMSWFDALCHAFGTMATGGFSTHDCSIGYYNSQVIEYTITVFMILAGTNFTLLYFVLIFRPGKLWMDVEWRMYIAIILVVTMAIIGIAMYGYEDFNPERKLGPWEEFSQALRYGLFQVVSIMTTTGYGTHNFDAWHNFGRGALFLLMFIGGCAGSTGGGLKVIRHVLFVKILRLEIEKSYRPNVVRHLRLAGYTINDPELYKNILLYFGLILAIFALSWLALLLIEPDATWEARNQLDNKLIDSASAVAATLNNIGPGLGIVGAKENYADFNALSKLLFTFLMMLGRLEIFSILVLCVPSFWMNR